MLRNCPWFLVVCVFFIAEGRRLDSPRDPNSEFRVPLVDKQVENLARVPAVSRVKRSVLMGRQEILDELCEVFNEFRGGHSAHRQYFHQDGRLDNMDVDVLDNVDLNLQHRRARTRECCRSAGEDRLWCFESYHIRRIDQYCRDGSPDIPFRQHTRNWHTDRKNRCCVVVGMDRLDCFRTIQPTAELGEEVPQDDLDPAYDATHYTNTVQQSDLPQQHGETQRGPVRPRQSSALPRATIQPNRQRDGRISTPTPTRDLCCAAGQVSGSELTSDVFRTCYANAAKLVNLLPSPRPSDCEEAFFDCCRQAGKGSQESDDDRTAGVAIGAHDDAENVSTGTDRSVTLGDQSSTERRRGRSRGMRQGSTRRSGRRRNHRRPNREGRRRRTLV